MVVHDRKRNEFSPAVLVLILLFFLFPPLAIVGAIVFAIYKQGKKNPSAEGSSHSMDAQTMREAKAKFLRRLKEEDAAEQPYKSHYHTPVSYSYDSCAKEKRLEQLKVLKSAGLLDEVEYQQRRQAILK